MTYKDLNVYKRAYKVAIDLHRFLDQKADVLSTDEINPLKQSSKSITNHIAEGFAQRSPKAKRFFNFKALETVHRLMMDLDFLRDTDRMSKDEYEHLYNEYDVCARQLYKYNQAILTSAKSAEKELASA